MHRTHRSKATIGLAAGNTRLPVRRPLPWHSIIYLFRRRAKNFLTERVSPRRSVFHYSMRLLTYSVKRRWGRKSPSWSQTQTPSRGSVIRSEDPARRGEFGWGGTFVKSKSPKVSSEGTETSPRAKGQMLAWFWEGKQTFVTPILGHWEGHVMSFTYKRAKVFSPFCIKWISDKCSIQLMRKPM